MTIARVALDVPLATLFDYTVPQDMLVVPGQRVAVPFGTRELVGVVMELMEDSAMDVQRIKPLSRALQD